MKKTILLVEDEIILAMTEKMSLEQYGYAVVIANSGKTAVGIVAGTSDIDLVLMDIDLGEGMDGTQAAAEILSMHDLPIVFLSSHTESEIVEKTEKITSYGYVVKNSSITVLDASIKMAFKLFNANRKTRESEKRFHLLFNSIQTVNTLYEVIRDANGTPVDYRYLEVNPAFEKMVGMPARELIGKTLLELFPKTERYWLDAFKDIIEKNAPQRFEQYSEELNSHTELYVYLPQYNQLAMSSRDISDRKQAETALRKMNDEYEALNERLRSSLEGLHRSEIALKQNRAALIRAEKIAKIGNWTLKLDTREIIASHGSNEIYGVNFDQVPLSVFQKIPLLEYREMMDRALADLVSKNTPYDIFFRIRRQSDDEIIDIHSIADYDRDSNTVFGVISDVTEYRNAIRDLEASTEKLKRSEQRYHSFFNLSNEAMLLTAPEGDILAANSAACEMFGASEEEITKNGRKGIMDMTDPRLAPALEQRKKTGLFRGELTCLRKNGGTFACELSSSVFSDVDGLQKTGIVIRDITARKQAEERAAAFLADKELLLKEVHHRIKNNMSSINGLLVLQAGTLKDPAAVSALEEAGNRVKSMQLLYDKLYRSPDYDQLPLCDYLDPLVDEVTSNFPNRASVRIEKDISRIMLKTAMLQPLGIIVNELLSNAMKYAFVGRTAGLVTVSATVSQNRVILAITDDGNGMPESVDFEHSTGFGLVLVNGLTQQLEGMIRIERGEGTRIVLELICHQ